MLTESELAWLKRRQFFNGFYTSSGCLTCSLNETLCDKTDCLLHPDLEDALEFSERVIEKLADPYFPSMDKGSTFECGLFIIPSADRLRCARLAVEEEMDGEA